MATLIVTSKVLEKEIFLQIIARSTENTLVKCGDNYYLIPFDDEDMQIIHKRENGIDSEDAAGNSIYKEPTTLLCEVSEVELWTVIKNLPFPLDSTDWLCENLPDWTIEKMKKLSEIVSLIRKQNNRLDYVGGDLFLDFKFEIYNGDFATLTITSPKSSLQTELFYEDDELFIDIHTRNQVYILGFISMYAQNYFEGKVNFLS